MPKPRTETTISDNGQVRVVEIETATGGEEKGSAKTRYSVPSNAKVAQEMILGLSDVPDGGAFERSIFGADFRTNTDGSWKDSGESPLALFYRAWCNIVDKMARAAMYESVAAQSTFITVGKTRVDVMTFPVKNIVRGVNGARALVETKTRGDTSQDARDAAEKSVGYGPWRQAALRLIESGKAKENEASGMLELALSE